MPHVQIDGPCDVRSYWERFEPRVHRDGDRILKTTQTYLVECTVVEGYLRQNFLAQLVPKQGGALVRIFHGSHPEKTEGIRHCLAWIASELLSQNPACRWSADNLGLSPPAGPVDPAP
jgi:hypothetical protein